MRRLTWFLAAALLVAVAMPALAGHEAGHKAGSKAGSKAGYKAEKCSQDAQTCLNSFSAKKDKGYMGVEYEKNEAGALVIEKVTEGGPAAEAGFLVGDIMVARNGIKMSDHEAMKADKASWNAGAKVTFTVLRKDEEKKLAVTLAPMPEEVYARMVGQHMISDHMAVASTAAATEPEAKIKTAEADKK